MLKVSIKFSHIYFNSLLHETKVQSDNYILLLNVFNNNSVKFTQNLLNLTLNKDNIVYYNILLIIDNFINNIIINNKKKIIYIDQFIKKLKKQNITNEKLNNKFNNKNNIIKLEELTHLKYIYWLFN